MELDKLFIDENTANHLQSSTKLDRILSAIHIYEII